jgi:hypothetical protein
MPDNGQLLNQYNEVCALIARGNSKEVSLLLDQCDLKFKIAWTQVYESFKDMPSEAPKAAENLIRLQPQLSAVTLAIARLDSESLFSRFKRTLEFIARSTERLPGYPAIAGVPHLQAGFLYMAAATTALHSEGWKILQKILTTKFEWYYQSGRPIFSYAFDLPYFFHSEALGRSGPKIHDFYRAQLQSSQIVETTNLSVEDALNVYLQAQMLMCLRVAQLREQDQTISIWPDFGRFYGERVAPLFDRAHADPDYARGILRGFDEDSNTFFARLNERLHSIASNFFRGAPYFYESLTSWEPVHS